MPSYDKNFSSDAYAPPQDGVVFNWAETGTEGPVRSFQDAQHMRADGSWSYDGLNPLQKGDMLTIFNDASKKAVLWQGQVDLDAQHHLFQQGVNRADWSSWFGAQKPATLQRLQK